MTYSKVHLSFYLCMNSLIKANNHIFPRLPLETSLSSNYIVGINSFTSEFFDTTSFHSYPSRLPAESLVFWVELACIFEA